MPPVPNRRARREAKFKLPKEDRVSILDGQIEQFKRTLFGHEANIERLATQLDALPEGDASADERKNLEAAIVAEERAMDQIESAIESTTSKRDAIKAS